MAAQPNPLIFLSAGEASGDHYGAQLIAELRQRHPAATFLGLGGTEMEEAGQRRIVRAEDVAVMGITEILRHIPRIYASYRRLVACLRRERPHIAVLIDFPDVNFRLAKYCRRLGIPVLWFVSPQLWAWKRRRLRWVQQRVDRILVIFPFEEAFYRARGVDAEFVGHPLASLALPTVSREQYALQATEISQDQWFWNGGPSNRGPVIIEKGTKLGGIRYKLDAEKQWIALLPGSRYSEVSSNLQEMIKTAYDLLGDYEFIVPLAPTITARDFKVIQYNTGGLYLGNSHPPRITFVRDARAALYHSRAAIVASGTATVQALTIGTPFVVVYRVSRLTFALAKRLVRYPAEIWPPTSHNAQRTTDDLLPIAMVNLIAGRRIVPELLNDRFTAANVAEALKPLLADTPARARMIEDLAEARQRLLAPGTGTPIERLADAVDTLLAPKLPPV